MNNKVFKYFDQFIHFQQRIYNKYTEVPKIEVFTSLSPIADVSDGDFKEYGEALSWALNNRETYDIKNIAVTGPYGSGKSSIIKTFQKKNDNKSLKFLNISLATFKEDKPENEEDLLRLVELSILQQIFYHEEDHNIPDSRFKKIKKLTR